MFIEVARSGGVAGLTRRARIDIEAIGDEASAKEWRRLVDQAKPMIDSHSNSCSNQDERDTFLWTVSVDDATCEIADSAITGPLRDLAQRTLREGRRRE